LIGSDAEVFSGGTFRVVQRSILKITCDPTVCGNPTQQITRAVRFNGYVERDIIGRRGLRQSGTFG